MWLWLVLGWLFGTPALLLLLDWIDRWKRKVEADKLLRSVGFDARRLGQRRT